MTNQTRVGQSIRPLWLVVGTAAIAAALATQPAAAQRLDGGMPSSMDMGRASIAAPMPGPHLANPSMSLGAPAPSPLQQQMQDDYATSLMNTQRQLLQQNPSGDTPSELSIGSQLNSYPGPR